MSDPIVFVHGLWMTPRSWDKFAERYGNRALLGGEQHRRRPGDSTRPRARQSVDSLRPFVGLSRFCSSH